MQPSPIHLTSGDLLADRRYEWAREAREAGDLPAAADLLAQVLELAPDYASAWFALGEVREKLGKREPAIAAFRKAREVDPADRHGAGLHLIRLGAAPTTAMSEDYVRTLFDGYAAGFDEALPRRLGYRAPVLLLCAVERACARMKFGAMLDLGCGTGLGGIVFRPFADWMVGVDLSPAMLAEARKKGIYDRLIEADIARFLAGEAAIKAHYHLVLAADVFVYADNLAPLMAAIAAALAPSALLAFSVETHEGDGVILRDTLRYAQGEAHVRGALAAAGLNCLSLEFASTRTEKGVAVPGLVVAAQNR